MVKQVHYKTKLEPLAKNANYHNNFYRIFFRTNRTNLNYFNTKIGGDSEKYKNHQQFLSSPTVDLPKNTEEGTLNVS